MRDGRPRDELLFSGMSDACQKYEMKDLVGLHY